MPCWTVQRMSVEFKVANVGLLKSALKRLGWTYNEQGTRLIIGEITLHLDTQKAELPVSAQPRLNQLKRAYSWEAIQTASRAKGWTATTTNATQTVGRITKW